MSSIENIGNLSRSGVRPLRSTAKARDSQPETVRSFSVEALKNGGTMELGGMLEDGTDGRGSQSIRDKYRGGAPAPSARRSQNSQLSPEEQVEKLGKIRKSAVEYESVFVDQLVKQMRQSQMAETPGGDTLSDIAEQPFRDFLSRNGGIGLADTIVNQVARQEGLEQTLQQNPGIMGPNWRPTVPPNLMKKTAGNLTMSPEDLENDDENVREALAPGLEDTLKNILAGAEKMAAPLQEAAATTGERRPVGLMNSEEIAYLYNEAQDGLV